MTMPEPGWFTDPQDERHHRWWNGAAWTEHRKPRIDEQSAPVAEYVPFATQRSASMDAAPISRKAKDREIRKNNAMAYTGLVLSLVGFLINPFAVMSLLGIIFSAIGMAKSHELEGAGQKAHGRGTAIAGIIVGIAGLIAFAFLALN